MAAVYKYELTIPCDFDGLKLTEGDVVDAFYNVDKDGYLIFLNTGWFWIDNTGLLKRKKLLAKQ